ncbi:MAG: BspA family leucine-rich repeat surface protein [Bacteroidota bacterium]
MRILLLFVTLFIFSFSPLTAQLSVNSFTLVDAETNEDVFELQDGQAINISALPTTSLNIRANTAGGVESVGFELGGALSQTKTESFSPYALFGDISGNYIAQEFPVGNYSLTATPFSGRGLRGEAGTALTINFSINAQPLFRPFITTWKTDNRGASADNQITIPVKDTNPFGPALVYNYHVDWGDGSTSENVTGDITHTYAVPGTYTVSITGQFPKMEFGFESEQPLKDNEKLLSVEQWGDIAWEDLRSSFARCKNLDVIATDTPDLSLVWSLNAMFSGCSNLVGNDSFGNWDMTPVRDTSLMFGDCSKFNQDISGWNMSNVTDMASMFSRATFFNQNIGVWNTDNLTQMVLMFLGASSFNQDISEWNVSSVSDFGSVFANATSFDQDLSGWNVSNATELRGLFSNSGLSDANYDNILIGWSQLPSLQNGVVLDAPQNAYCASVEERQLIIDTYGWTINDLGQAFNCGPNQQRPFITVWKTDNPGVSEDNQITIPTFPGETYNYTVDWGDNTTSENVAGGITHTYQNSGTYTVTLLGEFPRIYFNNTGDKEKLRTVQQWGDIGWTSMEDAFNGCSLMDVTAQDRPNLEQVLSMKNMFSGCNNLTGNFNISNWDTGKVTDMSGLFEEAEKYNISLGQWDVSQVRSMDRMLRNATTYDHNVSSWDVSSVESMVALFDGSGLSNENYDRLLIGWNNLETLQQDLVLGAAEKQFCQAGTARQNLITTWGWTINDNDQQTGCSTSGLQPFITTWKTDNPGISEENQITIPTFPFEVYNYEVDWGDGTTSENVTGSITHTYATPGIYTVRISGFFPAIHFNNNGEAVIISDARKLLTVEQWGDIQWSTMNSAFAGCENMDVVATDIPDFSNMQDATGMFRYCRSLVGNSTFNSWDMSRVSSLFVMFNEAEQFNQDISGWDTGSVITMGGTFQKALSFNQDIGAWNVSQVTIMFGVFLGATSFDQSLSNWDVSQVTGMFGLFDNSGLSNENYDATLIGWSQLPALQNNVMLDAPQNQFCEAAQARQDIIDTYNWTINDDGEATNCGVILQPFVTTWKSDNPGVSEDNQITIPTFPEETYDYTVDWGDGSTSTNVTGDIIHTYATPGTYTVSITGQFPRIYFNDFTFGFDEVSGDEKKLLNVKQWGTNPWTSMESAFAGCSNLSVAASDKPDLSNVTSLRTMFSFCNYSFDTRGTREFGNFNGVENFNAWDVSTITDMSGMFDKSSIDQDISSWDVSNVLDMSFMFFSSTFNSAIGDWNVGKVVNMSSLFGASSFNQDISAWDVGNVQFFDFIFNSTFFNQDITGWNVESAISMSHAFSQSSFDQNLSSWNVSNVTDLSNAFDDSDLTRENYDAILIAWSQLPNLQSGVVLGANKAVYCEAEQERNTLITEFGWIINDSGSDCTPERPFITTWKTDNPGPSNDNQITIPTNTREVYNYTVDWGDGSFDEGVTGDITHTYETPGVYTLAITGKFPRIFFNGFEGISEFPSKDPDDLKIIAVNQWGSNRWKSMSFAFAGCENMDVVATDIPDFTRVTALSEMFLGCLSLTANETIGDWNTSGVRFAPGVFRSATSFNQNISGWDVGNMDFMAGMFRGAAAFDQDLGNWNISGVQNMTDMFTDAGLSNENYDRILIGWSQLPALQQNVPFGAPQNQFCEAADARQSIIDSYGWNINDAGQSCPTLSINSFTLINADTEEDLLELTNGTQIVLSALPTNNFSIRANGTEDIGSVRLVLDGPLMNTRTESAAPFALFGDVRGNYKGNIFPVGMYSLTATPYSENRLGGVQGTPLSINFEIVAGPAPDFEISFTEMNQPTTCGGDEGLVIGTMVGPLGFYEIDLQGPVPFSEPLTIEMTAPDTTFTLSFLIAGDYVFSVTQLSTGNTLTLAFTLEDPDLPEVTLAPFADVLDTDAAFPLTGGSPEGGTYSGPGVSGSMFDPAAVGIGSYEIEYTFTDPNTGCENKAIQLITVGSTAQNAITGFVLVNADTNEDIGSITDGMVFAQTNLLTTNLNIRAEATSDVESVRLALTGPLVNSRNENVAPYALFGDRASNYFGRLFPLGSFSITATPYSENGLRGDQGTAITVSFSIALPQSAAPPNAMRLYPNPATELVTMEFELPTNLISIQVFDISGRLVREEKVEEHNGDYQMPVFDLPVGKYFVRTVDNKGEPFIEQMVIER